MPPEAACGVARVARGIRRFGRRIGHIRDVTDPRIAERRILVARELGRTRRRVVIAVIALAVLAAASIALVHSSVFGARSIRISGTAHVSRTRLLRTAGLLGSPPLVDLSPRLIALRLDRLPWVRSVAVSISFPSTVSLLVTSRTPVATAPSGHDFAVLDPSGRVLEEVARRPRSLPLVELGAPSPAPGRWTGREGRVLCALAAAMPERMVRDVSRLFEGREGASARLTDGIEAVFGGASEAHDKFVSLATLLARVSLTGVATVDIRVPASPVLIR